MLDYVRLYPKLIGAQIRSQMQYRAAFAAEVAGSFLITGLDFVAVVILLTRFQAIGAWTLAEVALLYGTSAISFSLTELFSGIFDGFDQLVVRGEFDRVLIRPLNVVFQMMTGAFPLRRFSRMAQGALALGLGLYLLHPAWGPEKWLFLAITLFHGHLHRRRDRRFLDAANPGVGQRLHLRRHFHDQLSYAHLRRVDAGGIHLSYPNGLHQLLPGALSAGQAGPARAAGLGTFSGPWPSGRPGCATTRARGARLL